MLLVLKEGGKKGGVGIILLSIIAIIAVQSWDNDDRALYNISLGSGA